LFTGQVSEGLDAFGEHLPVCLQCIKRNLEGLQLFGLSHHARLVHQLQGLRLEVLDLGSGLLALLHET
jgi:hypothetical protein